MSDRGERRRDNEGRHRSKLSRYRSRSRDDRRVKRDRSRSPRGDDGRRSGRYDRDDRVEEKMKRFEERRRQDKSDAQYEWGGNAPSDDSRKKEPTQSLRSRLAESRDEPLARYADDAKLNASLKERTRWDDPARTFVETLKPVAHKHKYQDNRFGIPPGQGWDGVDRGNGFEARWFKAQAQRKTKKEMGEQYAVQNY